MDTEWERCCNIMSHLSSSRWCFYIQSFKIFANLIFDLENLAINGHRNNFLRIWFVVLNNAMNHTLKSTSV